MGYKSARNASILANNYKVDMILLENYIRDNFEDMDFENADKRVAMENIVIEIEKMCEDIGNRADNLLFE